LDKDERSLVAHCGLYCGECVLHRGEIADLARDLRKKLRGAKFDRVAQGLSQVFKDFENYEQCYKVLGAMVRLRCKRTCRGGGGPPACKIRVCCQKKNIEGCWECHEFETCGRFDFLKTVHGDANAKNIRRIRIRGMGGFLAGAKHW